MALAQSEQEFNFGSSPNPVGSGARALGWGSAFIAVADDATAASWNPGGLIGGRVVSDHDAGVSELPCYPGFEKKALEKGIPLGWRERLRQSNGFERHRPIDNRIMSTVNHTHGTTAYFTTNLVSSKRGWVQGSDSRIVARAPAAASLGSLFRLSC